MKVTITAKTGLFLDFPGLASNRADLGILSQTESSYTPISNADAQAIWNAVQANSILNPSASAGIADVPFASFLDIKKGLIVANQSGLIPFGVGRMIQRSGHAGDQGAFGSIMTPNGLNLDAMPQFVPSFRAVLSDGTLLYSPTNQDFFSSSGEKVSQPGLDLVNTTPGNKVLGGEEGGPELPLLTSCLVFQEPNSFGVSTRIKYVYAETRQLGSLNDNRLNSVKHLSFVSECNSLRAATDPIPFDFTLNSFLDTLVTLTIDDTTLSAGGNIGNIFIILLAKQDDLTYFSDDVNQPGSMGAVVENAVASTVWKAHWLKVNSLTGVLSSTIQDTFPNGNVVVELLTGPSTNANQSSVTTQLAGQVGTIDHYQVQR